MCLGYQSAQLNMFTLQNPTRTEKRRYYKVKTFDELGKD